jgi:hypothetical protein
VSLGKFVFIDADSEVELDLDAVLEMGEDINSEFSRQAANYAYIATLAAKAAMLEMEANHQKDVAYAETYKTVRRRLSLSGEKFTEAVVNSDVEVDEAYRDAVGAQTFYKGQNLLMKALTRAMEMKADMLISKGAHLRSELAQTDMHINTAKDALRKFRDNQDVQEVKNYDPPF